MFFFISKALWLIAQPASLILLLLLVAFAVGFRRKRGLSQVCVALAAVILFACAFTSLGYLALQPLEETFPHPAPPADIAGIIVLGGGMDAEINAMRHGYELNRSGDRFVEALRLAQAYPRARILISGGSGMMFPEGDTEAQAGSRFFTALGIDPARIIEEGGSRNTEENARLTRETLNPKPGDTWLLVTSAFHMPRSVGLFRKAGIDVVPWPTDYFTTGGEGVGLRLDQPSENFSVATRAMREWVGLLAYWLTGKIDEPWPKP
ncbi:MAG TPA: YdcF family protein [Devosia sp.]